ncbi:MAG TPA: hypothetical protein VEX62_10770 [Candidatus Limnocylindrales bacterium]|nr:hypothetical protein [Candidatus Limnocylindrales bacterium]
MTVAPMLGDRYRPNTWAPVRVRLENDGPAVRGDVRISGGGQESAFSLPVELASGARQEHIMYALVGPLGGRFKVALVSGASELVTVDLRVGTIETTGASVYVIAERPEALVETVRELVTAGGSRDPSIVSINADDLPSRAQALASADVIVWQDIDTSSLDAQRLDALRAWLATGGHLVVLGGSTGTATLTGFPEDMLPYRPERVADVPPSDLEAILGSLPADAGAAPAVVGTLVHGTSLASNADGVIAATSPYGQGSVALIGVDPTLPILADSTNVQAFWAVVLPSTGARTDPVLGGNDDHLVLSLGNLPSVQVPQFEQLAILVVAYVVAVGPLNYLVLRRRNRREWAWLTMPATMLVFAVGAYAYGVSLRGGSVIVNELAVVHGAANADRGVSEIHVGLYSPTRATFDVRVAGDALLSSPVTTGWRGDIEPQPMDVIEGDPSTLRNFGVGFGVQRSFRAEASVATPRIETDLTLTNEVAEGTVTNASDTALDHVSVIYGTSFQVIGPMAAGESRPVRVAVNRNPSGMYVAMQLFPDELAAGPDAARSIAARRAVIQHLAGASDNSTSAVFSTGPVVLAWRSGGILDIDTGTSVRHLGETLYVLPARARATGPTVFSRGSIVSTVVDADAVESFEEGGFYSMGRGTVTAEYRPLGFDGTFDATGLSVRLGATRTTPAVQADELQPLPAEEQPDSDTPLASNPRPGEGPANVPRVQLFDRIAQEWIEFTPLDLSRTYRIPDPERYVDSSGSLLVRFVVRPSGVFTEFTFDPRLEGTIR